jgi:hypothetical protein
MVFRWYSVAGAVVVGGGELKGERRLERVRVEIRKKTKAMRGKPGSEGWDNERG